MRNEMIPVSRIELNVGQLEGVPANPRTWTYMEMVNLCNSIRETPELFEARGCLVVPHGDKYVVLGGNMRLVAAQIIGMESVPAIVMDEPLTSQQMREIVVKDNSSFGLWDWEKLAQDWKNEAKAEWGVPIPVKESQDTGKVKAGAVAVQPLLEVAFMPVELVFVTQALLRKGDTISDGLLNLLGYGRA